MWFLTRKILLFISLFLCFSSPHIFSQGVCLTESEYQELMNIIKTSKTNSETQMKLITDLRTVLAAQEAKLQQALNYLEQSETDLTELRASLSRIRTYSEGLNEYCKTLESENNSLKSKNNKLKTGIGITGGASAVMLILFLIMFI